MHEERLKILQMLQAGKLTIEEAATLFDAMADGAVVQGAQRPSASAQTHEELTFDTPGEQSVQGRWGGGLNLRELNLQGANLHSAALAGLDLSKLHLEGVNLMNADLRKTNCREVSLQGANLAEANFAEADLRGADLQGAYIDKTNFRNADLRDADFAGAMFGDADFAGANLTGTNFQGANFTGLKNFLHSVKVATT